HRARSCSPAIYLESAVCVESPPNLTWPALSSGGTRHRRRSRRRPRLPRRGVRVSRSSDSDVPPSPEPADDHDSIIPGLDPVELDRQELAPGADTTVSGDPGPRKGGRGRMLAVAGGGAALVVVGAVLALSHHGGQPGTAAAGTGPATTAPAQSGATAE